MFDAREPKNGDFVAYVEQFVRLPQGVSAPDEHRSPGQVSRGDGGLGALAKHLGQRVGRRPGAGDRPPRSATMPRVPAPAPSPESAWGHSVEDDAPARRGPAPGLPTPAGPPDLDGIARSAARTLAAIGRRFAAILLFAGLALLALSFADQPFIEIDPAPGVGLVAAGAILRRIASRVS